MGILHRLNRIFRCESPHDQGQLTVGRRLDGEPVNPQHVLRSVSAAVHFHNKLDVFHGSFLFYRSNKKILTRNETTNRKRGDLESALFSHLHSHSKTRPWLCIGQGAERFLAGSVNH